MEFEKYLPDDLSRQVKAIEGLIHGLEQFMIEAGDEVKPQTTRLYDKMLDRLNSLK